MNSKVKHKESSNSNAYSTIVDFAKFLRQNGDKLFEKDSKLCLKTDQILILAEYLEEINSTLPYKTHEITEQKIKKKNSTIFNTKDFILLYKSNYLHLIQDFLYKITNLKIISESPLIQDENALSLSIFGSITYLEIKNCPIMNISNVHFLRSQLEVLICNRSVNELHDLLYSCGKDNCNSPVNWPKLNTLNLSHNQLSLLDNNLRLTTSIEILDLSHNNLKDCGENLHFLTSLKKLNLSFNNLKSIPSINGNNAYSSIEYLDLSFNNIDSINSDRIKKLDSLKHLNLKSNLINSINQLNKLSALTNISYISIKENPIAINPISESIIQEIVELVKYNKNKKASEYTFPKPAKQSISGIIRVKKKSPEIKIKDGVGSNIGTLASSVNYPGSFIKRKSKLRVNNITIDPDKEEALSLIEKDFVIIGDGSNPDSGSRKSPSMSIVKNDYESNKLQDEIKNLKIMRESYGTDWLLSTPNLQVENERDSNNVKNSEALIEENGEDFAEVVHNSDNKLSMNEIIDSFVVYRSIYQENSVNSKRHNLIHNDQESEEPKVLIIALNDCQLIEKDELNTEILSVNQLSNLSDIDIIQERNKKLVFKFQKSYKHVVYQFENEQEFNLFIEVIRKILFNCINLKSCALVYCIWCTEFVKKSKFKLFDENSIDEEENNESSKTSSILEQSVDSEKNQSIENLTCTKCSRYLIKDQRIQSLEDDKSNENFFQKDSNGLALGVTFSLKEALNKEIEAQEEFTLKDDKSSNASKTTEQLLSDLMPEPEIDISKSPSAEKKLEELLNNNQLTKKRLDEVTNECKRISNNLKLYLIVNVLKSDEVVSDEDNDDEVPIAIFKMKYFFYIKNLSEEEVKLNKNPLKKISNCLCLLTNKNLILFKILDLDSFNRNMYFDTCLKKKLTVEVNQIETIEIGVGQNYLIIEKYNENKNMKIVNYKFVTLDIYQSQAFLSTILKIINESKKITMLKNIKKKNEKTNMNLLNLIQSIESQGANESIGHLPVTIYTRIQNLAINETTQINLKFEYGIQVLFLHNDEDIILVEENLMYDQFLHTEQYHFIASAKISDIVHLRLFPDSDSDTKLEISLIDESKNSTQVTWVFNMNESHILSQFIAHLKETWEQIFSIEMPINY